MMGMTHGSYCPTHNLSPTQFGEPSGKRKAIDEKLEAADIKPLDEKNVKCPYCAYEEGLREGELRAKDK